MTEDSTGARGLTLPAMLARLGVRREAFELMLAHVAGCDAPLIVETGCARLEDNFTGDGMSTLIWDAAAELHGGRVRSVDLDPAHVAFARGKVGAHTTIDCADSVAWLAGQEAALIAAGQSIDLLYLDSYDLDVANWHPSALHHIYELLSIKGALRPGALLAVDDNLLIDGQHVGKGTYVAEYLARIGKPMIYQGYQWIWRW